MRWPWVGVGAGGLLLASDRKPKRTRGSRKRVHKTGFLDDLYSEEDASLMLDDPLDENQNDFTASGQPASDVRPGALIPSDAPVQRSIDSSAAVTKVAAGARVASLDSADEQNSTENGSAMSWIRRGLMAVCLGSLLMAGLLSSREDLSDVTASATASVTKGSASVHRYESVPIREIQAGRYRVLADNPETPGQAPADYGEFDRETWRVLRLQLTKPDGGWLKVSLARPLEWIEDVPRNADGDLWLEFEELGIANWAQLLGIDECPEVIIGDGRLVTGTFHHSAANVIELSFSHSAETVTTTANHPFWSEDRQEFVQAGELATGEHLRLRDGTTSRLTGSVALDEEIPVYNLEVDGEHVYYAGHDGVLVHNADHSYIREHAARDGNVPHDVRNKTSVWGGSDVTENHHPLKQSGRFFREVIQPNVKDVKYSDVKDWTVPIDQDVHQAFEKAGWWEENLGRRIEDGVLDNGGPLTVDQLRSIANSLLDEVETFHPGPIPR